MIAGAKDCFGFGFGFGFGVRCESSFFLFQRFVKDEFIDLAHSWELKLSRKRLTRERPFKIKPTFSFRKNCVFYAGAEFYITKKY
jgi:hypothetical protein